MSEPIGVTVIGGYLGAGKTTLVNHVLRHADEHIAVLVNDFGSVDIDTDLIVSADDDTITLANGCICCSLADGFAGALDRIRGAEVTPDRLVIEASGVADPGQVAAYGHAPGLRLDGVVTVVDAHAVRRQAEDTYVGDTVRRQLRAADVVVVNKTDLVSADELAAVTSWLAGAAPGAAVVDAVSGRVPLETLFGVRVRSGTCSEPPTPAEDRYRSWSLVRDEPLDRAALEATLDALPAGVVRAKGIVRLTDDPGTRVVVQRVGDRHSLTADGPWRGGPSRLVAIGVTAALPLDWTFEPAAP